MFVVESQINLGQKAKKFKQKKIIEKSHMIIKECLHINSDKN